MQDPFPNLRHLRVFLQSVATGSISAAAEICYLSQPAATQAMKQLEARLGVRLLHRKRLRATPTASGRLLARRAEAALKFLDEGAAAARREGGDKDPGKVSGGPDFAQSVTASQLRNLIAIANSGSFTMAAGSLGLSQPSVHRTARALEAVSGLELFQARPSGVRLTPAAETFVRAVKLAQAELRQGIAEISREQGREKGSFVLGSLPLARTMIVPKALDAMVRDTDGFQIRVVEGRYGELLRSLREGDLDCLIGALRFPVPAEDVNQEFLFADSLAIVAHPSHPLARKRGVTMAETLAYPWIAPPKETPAGQYLFETLRIEEQPETPVRIVVSSMAVLRGVLAEGPYLSVVSKHQIQVDERLGVIRALDIPLEGHSRDIGLTYRREWTPTKTQARFIDYLRDFSAIEGAV